ncbi:class C beta-lactamase [Sphingobacterium sp. HMA12]|uniref:class C beta-lactamase n=1 Tax=Sphingobacterium sp. HMA12 TaxID=2050894 RepID=UPI000CEA1F52|nr:class C beta-lactamase [Sphingobacterium sp. HMA12]
MYNFKIATTLLVCISSFLGGNGPERKTNDLQTYADALVRPVMQDNHISGLSIAVSINGKHTFLNYGVASKANGTAVSEQTLFELGSISKTFTVTLACLAEVEGKLDLSKPVSQYLPQLKHSAFDHINLYHLGTHTAGGFDLQLPDAVQNEAQLMDFYKSWKPEYAVGTQRIYTNPSIGLLGLIAGKAFQQPFPAAMTQHVLNKLHLSNTFYELPATNMEQYAQGYDKTDLPVRVNPAMLANEAYGVKSCTADMIKFVDANMGVVPVDKKVGKAISKSHTGYFRTASMTQDLIWEQYDYPVTLEQLQRGNAYDMIYQPNKVQEMIPHAKAKKQVLINKTGSTNGFGGYVMYIPAKKIGIVILANKNYPNAVRIDLAYQLLSYLEKEGIK